MRRAAAISGFWLALALALAPAPARAQIEPYVLLLFDTSGSMAYHTCGTSAPTDGSAECGTCDVPCAGPRTCSSACASDTCGNGRADDSRLYQVKAAAADVVNAFGEAVFALARFRQTAVAFSCPTNDRSGGWQGALRGCGGNAPGTGINRADVLVGFADDNQREILDWLDGCDDWDGGYRDGSWTPAGGAVDCGGGVAPAAGCGLCRDCAPYCCGAGCDKELRAHGATPLAGSLITARQYLRDVVRPADPDRACRPYRVILLSDGLESCNGDPEAEAAALCALGVRLSVVGFEAPEEVGLREQLDAIARAGCHAGCGCDEADPRAIMVGNQADLALEMAELVQSSVLIERCNGQDDDCDGLIDEDFPDVDHDGDGPDQGDPCENGESGACRREGRRVCAGATGTRCDAPPGAPGAEVCDGLDNDCDGEVDEAAEVGDDCDPTPCGPEQCNGEDDDCDGAIDEGDPGGGAPCGSEVGACVPGVTECRDGRLVCGGPEFVPPLPEIPCNCVDEDCNTVEDDLPERCYTFPTGCDAELRCTGTCAPGLRTCTCAGGVPAPGACVGEIGPAARDVCNGLDDDCDCPQEGPDPDPSCIDEDGAASCGGLPCIAGRCAQGCDVAVEFPCPAEQVCSQGVCVPDPCSGITCADGEYCRARDGLCVPLCDGVRCRDWETCMNGLCVDTSCSAPGAACPPGQVCVAHQCIASQCDGADPGCCGGVDCPPDAICCGAACRSHPCVRGGCPVGELCDPCAGGCVIDPCARLRCAKGQTCRDGRCIAVIELDRGGGCRAGVGRVTADGAALLPPAAFLLMLALRASRRRRR